MNSSCHYFEKALFLLLGLCAIELSLPGHHATITGVLSNVASLISHQVSTGVEISSVARYYLRALARQDLVVSLVQPHRPRIPSHIWLEDESTKPDRLLGYTFGLVPLLEELLPLSTALSVNSTRKSSHEETSSVPTGTYNWLDSWYLNLLFQTESVRMPPEPWKPTIISKLPFRSSRKFRAQAACYRAGALLYLHRLFRPPLSSLEANDEVLNKAHEIMLYTNGPPSESKMLLWSVFMAACEILDADGRAAALQVFDAIGSHRKTATVERTRKFVQGRVWKERDEGRNWNWMVRAGTFPGECLPI
ncbi:C6 zinc finger domain protein [Colletotrichum graminicola]|nr:C6 zinc finger domain protein [Colletotrichum graminicola]